MTDTGTKEPNAKQSRFIDEYLIDSNASAAGVRAGYSASYARRVCSTWVNQDKSKCDPKHWHIWEALANLQNERSKRTKIDADWVLERHAAIDEMDFIDILYDDMTVRPITEWPKIWRTYLSGAEVAELFDGSGDERKVIGALKKIKWPDKLKNLELIGKHVNVGAYSTKVDISPAEQFADIIKRRKK